MVILSRDFHGHSKNFEKLINNMNLEIEIKKLRRYWDSLKLLSNMDLQNNRGLLKDVIKSISDGRY